MTDETMTEYRKLRAAGETEWERVDDLFSMGPVQRAVVDAAKAVAA